MVQATGCILSTSILCGWIGFLLSVVFFQGVSTDLGYPEVNVDGSIDQQATTSLTFKECQLECDCARVVKETLVACHDYFLLLDMAIEKGPENFAPYRQRMLEYERKCQGAISQTGLGRL